MSAECNSDSSKYGPLSLYSISPSESTVTVGNIIKVQYDLIIQVRYLHLLLWSHQQVKYDTVL